MKIISLVELEKEAQNIVESLTGDPNQAVLIALHGDLGAGKTTLTQMIARALGVTENIISPTFLIQKTYPIEHPTFEKLVHIDAYRLESGEELLKINFRETLADPKNLIIIEWPERVSEILPTPTKTIRLTWIDETSREISYE